MAALPTTPPTDPTLDAALAALEAQNKLERPRPYLGMSAIGEECERRLWYSFRWCMPAGGGFDAKSLLNFADGHRTEDAVAALLQQVPGIELRTVDPRTQRQWGFHDLGGHWRGHADGLLRGLLQAPKAWHVWEHKASEKGPAELAKHKAVDEKSALAKWSPNYYAQAQCYMHFAQMERHYLTVTAPGGRMPWTAVRTNADPEAFGRLRAKAERVIFSAEPLGRLSEDPAHWKCKQCPAAAVCHGQSLPSRSCRTCLHSTPVRDGSEGDWTCALAAPDAGPIPLEFQAQGCDRHLYIPALLARWGEAVDASEQEGWVAYRAADGFEFRNGVQGVRSADTFSSRELATIPLAVLRSPELVALRAKHLPDAEFTGGRVVEEGV
jgi:hypothetical protein